MEGHRMEFLKLLLFGAIWIALVGWVLPRLGVPT
jgi:hypothetical protein